MLEVKSDEMKRSLDELKRKVTLGLESVVKGFIYDSTVAAIDKTPFGSMNSLYKIPSRTNFVPARVGAAKGGWVVSFNRPTTAPFQEWADSKEAQNIKNFVQDDVSKYKLGSTVYIQNRVPYVVKDHWTIEKLFSGKEVLSLEGGYSEQAPNGIQGPTLDMIQNIFARNLQDYYEEQ